MRVLVAKRLNYLPETCIIGALKGDETAMAMRISKMCHFARSANQSTYCSAFTDVGWLISKCS
jgi:hypothetical protein